MKKLFLSSLFLIIAFFGFSQPKIQFDKTTHDFGEIKEEDGKVTARFDFTNTGDAPLKLSEVKASCGCTTPNWSKNDILPGQNGFVEATYNPAGRPGAFSKNIRIKTNEVEGQNNAVVFIKGRVEKRPPTVFEASGYLFGNGMVRIKSLNFNYETKNLVPHKDTMYVRNFWNKNVKIELKNMPAHIREISRNFGAEIAPNTEGMIIIEYDAKMKNAFGFQRDNFSVETNDSIEPIKKIFYAITIREDFSNLTPKQLAKCPVISIDKTKLEYGQVAKNQEVKNSCKITNIGKTPLIIRDVQPGINTITPSLTQTTVAQGASITIDFTYKALGKIGKQGGNIEIITNDPSNDGVLVVKFEAEMLK